MAGHAHRPAPGRPLRLLWLIDSLALGGAESLTLTLARALDPALADLHVCCLKTIAGNPLEAQLGAARVPCTNLEARNLRDLGALRRLVTLARRLDADVIHAHLLYACLFGAAAAALIGRPLVATLHVAPGTAVASGRDLVRHGLCCIALDRRAAAVLAVSGAVHQAYRADGRIDPARLRVLPNGIDVAAFRPAAAEERARLRSRLGVEPDERMVTTVSVLRPGKGLEDLLEAAPAVLAATPGARFVIAGDGPLAARLAELGARLGLGPRLRLLGYVSDVAELLRASDLFVLPSHADAFPTVLLEAMASGLAVIATRQGGIPEMVEHHVTGLLVAPGDRAALAAALVRLLGDGRLAAAMGGAGRARVKTRFSSGVWAARLLDLYAEVRRDTCASR